MSLPEPPLAKRPLFFLDYDGTLAPIVDDPSKAFPHTDVPALLTTLEARYPLWIITGRHLDHVAALMPEVQPRGVGLHGTQEGQLGGDVQSLMTDEAQRGIARLRQTVPDAKDVWVEEKGAMFAVHYRKATDKTAAQKAIRDWLRDMPDDLAAIWGKDVVEIRPGELNKGVAVRRIASDFPDRTPIYLGDDVTDEDAFQALGDNAITVKIGEGETAARYRLSDVEAVVAYLKRYAAEGE